MDFCNLNPTPDAKKETLYSGLEIPDFSKAIGDIRTYGFDSLPLNLQLTFGELFSVRDRFRAWSKSKSGKPLTAGEMVMIEGLDDVNINALKLDEETIRQLDLIDPDVQTRTDSEALNNELTRVSEQLVEVENAIKNKPDDPELKARQDKLNTAIGKLKVAAGQVMESSGSTRPDAPDGELVAMARAHVEQIGALPVPETNRIEKNMKAINLQLKDVRSQIRLSQAGSEPLMKQKKRLQEKVGEMLKQPPTEALRQQLGMANRQLKVLDYDIANVQALPPRDALLQLEENLVRQQYLLKSVADGFNPQHSIAGVPVQAIRRILGWLDNLGYIDEARALDDDTAKKIASDQRQKVWNTLPKPLRSGVKNLLKSVKDNGHRVKNIGPKKVLEEAEFEQKNRQEVTADRVEVKSGDTTQDISDRITVNMPTIINDLKSQYENMQGENIVENFKFWTNGLERNVDETLPDKELRRLVYDFVTNDGISDASANELLRPMLSSMDRKGTVAFLAARMQLDYSTQLSARAADKWLSLGKEATEQVRKETAQLFMQQFGSTLALRQAYNQTARYLGRNLRSIQIKPDANAILGTSDREVGDAWISAMQRENKKGPTTLLNHKVSKKMDDALFKLYNDKPIDWTDAELQQEMNVLAVLAKDLQTEPVMGAFADQLSKAIDVGAKGLMTMRTASILSSHGTFWVNTLGGLFKVAITPALAPVGALAGSPKDVPASLEKALLTYVQMGKQLGGAVKLAYLAGKHGVGLYDPQGVRLEGFGTASQVDDAVYVEPGEWNINNVGGDKWHQNMPHLAEGLDWVWKLVGTSPLRLMTASDTFVKTLQGNSEHWVRLYSEAKNRLVKKGQTENVGRDAAMEADKLLEAALVDVVINPLHPTRETTIAKGAMTNEYALRTARDATFTEDILVDPEDRTFKKGTELAKRRGAKDDEIQTEAAQYMREQGGKRISKAFTQATHLLWMWPQIIADAKKSRVGPLVSVVAPFIKTPTNIIKGAMRYSPLAPLTDTFWRDITSEDQIIRQRARGEMALGSAVLGWTYYQLNHNPNFEITGAGPSSYEERMRWQQMGGYAPFSYRFRENENSDWSEWTSYRVYEPLASVIGVMADYHMMSGMMSEEEKDRAAGFMLMKTLGIAATSQIGKTWFTGFSELAEMIERFGKSKTGIPGKRNQMSRWFQRNIATFVPLSSRSRVEKRRQDPTVRGIDAGNFGSELAGELSRVTPDAPTILGWDLGQVIPDLPGWGRPAVLDSLTGEPLVITGVNGKEWIDGLAFSGFLPAGPNVALQVPQYPTDPVKEELYKAGLGFSSYSGRSAKGRFTKGGKLVMNNMTNDEYRQWTQFRTKVPIEIEGKLYTLYDRLKFVMGGQYYQNLPDFDGKKVEMAPNLRVDLLQKEIKRFDKNADKLFLASPIADRINANLARFSSMDAVNSYISENGRIQPGVDVEKVLEQTYRQFGINTGN